MSADGQLKAGKSSRQNFAALLSGGRRTGGVSDSLRNLGSASSRSLLGLSPRPEPVRSSAASVTSVHSENSVIKKVSPSPIPGLPMSDKAREEYQAKH
jgi:hypothetical protein